MITHIADNETGASVRAKLNTLIDMLNAVGLSSGTADPSGDPGQSTAFYIQTTTNAIWIWNGTAWGIKA
jgi:hypothetical protein